MFRDKDTARAFALVDELDRAIKMSDEERLKSYGTESLELVSSYLRLLIYKISARCCQ